MSEVPLLGAWTVGSSDVKLESMIIEEAPCGREEQGSAPPNLIGKD
jgi:hypothetical protein